MPNTLVRAIFEDELDSVNRLLNSGADLNATGDFGMKPLMQAAAAENARIIELLVTRGASINAKGHEGWTALHIAVDMSIDGTIQSGGSPGEEPTSIIELLLSNGADPEIRTDKGETALDIAKAFQSDKIIRFLSEYTP